MYKAHAEKCLRAQWTVSEFIHEKGDYLTCCGKSGDLLYKILHLWKTNGTERRISFSQKSNSMLLTTTQCTNICSA